MANSPFPHPLQGNPLVPSPKPLTSLPISDFPPQLPLLPFQVVPAPLPRLLPCLTMAPMSPLPSEPMPTILTMMISDNEEHSPFASASAGEVSDGSAGTEQNQDHEHRESSTTLLSPDTRPLVGTTKARKDVRVSFAQPSCEVFTFEADSEVGSFSDIPLDQLSNRQAGSIELKSLDTGRESMVHDQGSEMNQARLSLAFQQLVQNTDHEDRWKQVNPPPPKQTLTSQRRFSWNFDALATDILSGNDKVSKHSTNKHKEKGKSVKARLRKIVCKLRPNRTLTLSKRIATKLRQCEPCSLKKKERYGDTMIVPPRMPSVSKSRNAHTTFFSHKYSRLPKSHNLVPPATQRRQNKKLQKRPRSHSSSSIIHPRRTSQASSISLQSTRRSSHSSIFSQSSSVPEVHHVTQTQATEGQYLPLISTSSGRGSVSTAGGHSVCTSLAPEHSSCTSFTTLAPSVGQSENRWSGFSAAYSSPPFSPSSSTGGVLDRPIEVIEMQRPCQQQERFLVPRKPLPLPRKPLPATFAGRISGTGMLGRQRSVSRGYERIGGSRWLPGRGHMRSGLWSGKGTGARGRMWVDF